MEKVIIVRYCEIHLKGNNRGYFEKVFQENLERALRGIRHEIRRPSGRYIVENFDESRADEIVARRRTGRLKCRPTAPTKSSRSTPCR